MEQKYLRDFEARCIQEEPPACQTMCPLHVEARTFAAQMTAGKLAEARKTLERSMPLAGLTGLLCAGDCVPHCRRAEIDGGVNMPLLEKACVTHTEPGRLMALPSTGKRVAVAGAGLSSLVCAFELAKKGHQVTIFYKGGMGGRLRALPAGQTAEAALRVELERLASLRVDFARVETFSPGWRDTILAGHSALYIGLDDSDCALSALSASVTYDFLTQETGTPNIFAGGAVGIGGGPALQSFVREAADGKRAAGSVVRLLQGVAPSTAREKEGVYPSALFTDISGVAPALPVVPLDPAAPSQAEAGAEAARCIQCQCLECVKRCAYLAAYNGFPKKYAREIYNNLAMVHGIRRVNRQINSCALCGLCAKVCPNGADMGEFCFAARHEMVASRRMPVSAHEFALEDMAHGNDPQIAFFRHQPGSASSAWVFFPGCQLPATLPGQSRDLYAHLCANLKGGVGFLFRCCGAPARWSGRPGLAGQNAEALRAQWQDAGSPTFILACASCVAFFKAELADIPFISLWDMLADLPLPPAARPGDVPLALHDPCAARAEPETRDNVRKILAALGQKALELPLGRELTRCCGYGGLADAANPDMGRAYALDRAGDSTEPMLAWCAMCRDRLRAVGKDTLHLLDLLFPSCPVKEAAARPAPGISERQEARQAFRRAMLAELWHEKSAPNSRMDDMKLDISDVLARLLEKRRILHDDVKAVLLHAEDGGAQFSHPQSGRFLASYRPKQVSYWVEYEKQADGTYIVHDAYCHRMVVPGVPGKGEPTAVILEGHNPTGGRV